MNEFVYKLTLDLNCAQTPPVICSGQFDKGRKFEFTITANGENYNVTGCSAILKGVNSDFTHFAVECSAVNGKIIAILDDTTLTVRGKTVAKLVIFDSTKSYSTQNFMINVDSSFDGDITVLENYSILNRLIQQIHALNESGAILVDDTINKDSNNAVANKAVAVALISKLDSSAGSVKTENIASKAVTSDKIAPAAITAIKIAKNAVGSNNIAENQINTNHLQNGLVTTDKLADEVKTSIAEKAKAIDVNAKFLLYELLKNKVVSITDVADDKINYPSIAFLKNYYYNFEDTDLLLDEKYDASNVETGSGELSLYTQSAIDSGLVKSLAFVYQKTGKIVNIFVNIVFNAGSASYLQLTGLPFRGDGTSDQNRYIAATNRSTQVIVYPVGTWLTLNFNVIKNFVQDETLKCHIAMQIN